MADSYIHWYYLPGYMAALLTIAGLLMRNRRVVLMASVLFIDWCAATLLADITGSQFEWAWLGIIDISAAWALILTHRRMEAVLSITYAIEVIIHISYGINSAFQNTSKEVQIRDWWMLFGIACLQALLLGFWSISGGGRRHNRLDGNRDFHVTGMGTTTQSSRDTVFPD